MKSGRKMVRECEVGVTQYIDFYFWVLHPVACIYSYCDYGIEHSGFIKWRIS
jgi:hypothetical protein